MTHKKCILIITSNYPVLSMIKRFFLYFLALFFPWSIMLIYDNPGGALAALVMQATAIGWLPATMWAFKVIKESAPQTRKKRKRN